MKRFRLLLSCMMALGLGGAVGLTFAAPANEADSAYEKAVAEYVNAAGVQLRAIRHDVEATLASATKDERQRYEQFFSKLGECERLYDQLKLAKPDRFDPAKAEFEKARTAAIAELESVRSAPPAKSSG